MSRKLIFWVLMLVWLIFSLAAYGGYAGHYGVVGGSLLQFVLFLLVGWSCYGPPIQGKGD